MNKQMKVQNIVFIIVIFVMMASPLVYWLSLGGEWNKSSIIEDRSLATFPRIKKQDFRTGVKRVFQGLFGEAGEIFFNDFTEGYFMRKANKAAAEQMPLRVQLVELAKLYERIVIKSAYFALPDTAIPASFDSGFYALRDASYLLRPLKTIGEQNKVDIDARIANYKELLEKFPQIQFYVFNIETLDYSESHSMVPYFPDADKGQSMEYFLDNKPAQLSFESFELDSFEDYAEHFFRTDQHWNIRGSIGAYQQIYGMLKDQFADISPLVEVEKYEIIEDLEFLGSFARKTLFPVEPDILEYAAVDLGEYTTYVNGDTLDYGGKEKYMQGSYNQKKFYNHYRGFFGKQEPLIHYHFENEIDRNLLLITSSYGRTIQMILASHFQDTYVIDLRFDENKNTPLSKLIEGYAITDVLIMGQPTVTYYSGEDKILP